MNKQTILHTLILIILPLIVLIPAIPFNEQEKIEYIVLIAIMSEIIMALAVETIKEVKKIE